MAAAALAKEQKIERRLYDAWLSEMDDAAFATRLQEDHAASRIRIEEMRAEIEAIRGRLASADPDARPPLFDAWCEELGAQLAEEAMVEQRRLTCEALRVRVVGNRRQATIPSDVGVLDTTSRRSHAQPGAGVLTSGRERRPGIVSLSLIPMSEPTRH
ncbi:MAG: hypothetical protein IRY99_24985 [Isosphaeraceae bacterium]|nr:hypothetical protein [Isosphaeraceae bacterium]